MSEIICADAFDALPNIPRGSVHCCVTSPPYFGLRDYKTAGQIGLEKDLETYILKLQIAFSFVHYAMRDDGTLWLNMGDTYKNKDMMGVPWKVAFALQRAGGSCVRTLSGRNQTLCRRVYGTDSRNPMNTYSCSRKEGNTILTMRRHRNRFGVTRAVQGHFGEEVT